MIGFVLLRGAKIRSEAPASVAKRGSVILRATIPPQWLGINSNHDPYFLLIPPVPFYRGLVLNQPPSAHKRRNPFGVINSEPHILAIATIELGYCDTLALNGLAVCWLLTN